MPDEPLPRPIYTFRVNLETVNRQSHLVPNRTEMIGNETVAEADYQRSQRTIFLPTRYGSGFIYRKPQFPADDSAGQGYYRHGDEIVAYGKDGLYLKNTYTHQPPLPEDVLLLVSVDP